MHTLPIKDINYLAFLSSPNNYDTFWMRAWDRCLPGRHNLSQEGFWREGGHDEQEDYGKPGF